MLKAYLLQSGFIYVFIFSTFLHAIYGLQWKNKIHRYVLCILTVFVLNEAVSTLQAAYATNFKTHFTITTVIHCTLWFLILKDSVHFPRIVNGVLIAFITFCFCDLLFIEGWVLFNCYSFVLGAFMYLILFLFESFYQLKQENFPYFFSNQFLLLMSPVLFFIGLTFMLAFKSHGIISVVIFGKVDLYRIIITVVNIVYYSLLNIYIYREKKKLYEF
jgi:hypothetical protein